MSTFKTFFENQSKLIVLHDSFLSFNNIRTVEVLIVEHPSFSCIEVVVYNPACIVEAPRIYINTRTLQTKLKAMVTNAENASQIHSRTECIVSYITSRLTVPDLPEFFLESKFCAKLIPVEDVDVLRGRGENTHIDVEYLSVPDHMDIYETYRPRLQWVTNKTNSFMCKVEAPVTPVDSPHTTRAAEIMGEATVEMFMDYHYNQSYLPGLMREEKERDEAAKQQQALTQALTINGSFPLQNVSGNVHMSSGTPPRPQTANTPPRSGSARPASRARTPGTGSRPSSRRTSRVVDVVNHIKLVTTTLQRAPTLRHILEVQKALNKHSQHKKHDVSDDRHMHDIAVNCIDIYKTLFVLCTSDARGNYAAAASTVFTNTLPALSKEEVLTDPNAVHKLHWIMTLWDCATDMAIYCSADEDEEDKRARSRQSSRPVTAGNVLGRDPRGLAVPIPRLPPPRSAFSSSRETSDDERETSDFLFDDMVSLGSHQSDDETDDYDMHWGGSSSRQSSRRNSRQGDSSSRGSNASLSNSSSLTRLDTIESRPHISVTVRKSGSSPALPPLSTTSATPIRDYMKNEIEPQLSPPRNLSTARYVTSNNSQISVSRAVQENRFQASTASPARVSSLQHHFDNLSNSINSIGALNTLTKSLEQTLLSTPSRQGSSTSRINSRNSSTKSVSRAPSRSSSRPTSPSGQSLAAMAASSNTLERREIALVGGIGSNGKVVTLPDFRYKQTAPAAPSASSLYKQSRSTNSSPVPSINSNNSVASGMSSKQGRSRIERATFDGNLRDQYSSGRSPLPSPRGNKSGALSLPNTGRDAWNDSEYVGIASPEKQGRDSPQRRGETDFAQAVHASNTMYKN